MHQCAFYSIFVSGKVQLVKVLLKRLSMKMHEELSNAQGAHFDTRRWTDNMKEAFAAHCHVSWPCVQAGFTLLC